MNNYKTEADWCKDFSRHLAAFNKAFLTMGGTKIARNLVLKGDNQSVEYCAKKEAELFHDQGVFETPKVLEEGATETGVYMFGRYDRAKSALYKEKYDQGSICIFSDGESSMSFQMKNIINVSECKKTAFIQRVSDNIGLNEITTEMLKHLLSDKPEWEKYISIANVFINNTLIHHFENYDDMDFHDNDLDWLLPEDQRRVIEADRVVSADKENAEKIAAASEKASDDSKEQEEKIPEQKNETSKKIWEETNNEDQIVDMTVKATEPGSVTEAEKDDVSDEKKESIEPDNKETEGASTAVSENHVNGNAASVESITETDAAFPEPAEDQKEDADKPEKIEVATDDASQTDTSDGADSKVEEENHVESVERICLSKEETDKNEEIRKQLSELYKKAEYDLDRVGSSSHRNVLAVIRNDRKNNEYDDQAKHCRMFLNDKGDTKSEEYKIIYHLDKQTSILMNKVTRLNISSACVSCGITWDEDITFRPEGIITVTCPKCGTTLQKFRDSAIE